MPVRYFLILCATFPLRVFVTLALIVSPVLSSTTNISTAARLASPIEENGEEEVSSAKTALEWLVSSHADRRSRTKIHVSLRVSPAIPVLARSPRPVVDIVAADPFRNGLGTHYRC